MEHFHNLKDFREDKDLTQGDIARILEITQQQYCLYETGKRAMPIHLYKKLALLYNISIDYLCGITITPRTLTGEPNQISKNYSIRQNGKITNNFK